MAEDNGDAIDIASAYKSRYEKSLKVVRKFKNQYHFEVEVSKELARRNDELLRSQQIQAEKIASLQATIDNLVGLVLKGADDDARNLARTLQPVNRSSPVKTSSSLTMSGARGRRQSAVCIALPELSGTSLVRKIADGDSDLVTGGHGKAVLSEDGPGDKGLEILSNHTVTSEVSEALVTQNDELYQVKMAPLFEHFIVVGATPEAATGAALKARQIEEDKSYSAFLMKRLGGMLGTSNSGVSNRNSLPRHSTPSSSSIQPPSVSVDDNHNHAINKDNNSPMKDTDGSVNGTQSQSVATTRPSFFSTSSTKSGSDISSPGGAVVDPGINSNVATSTSSFSLLRGVSSSSILSRFTPFSGSQGQQNLPPVAAPPTREHRSSSSSSSETVVGSADGTQSIASECSDSSVVVSANAPSHTTIIAAPSVNPSDCTDHSETDASMLYRYPLTVEPPPAEVCDFCLPLGGRLQRLNMKDQATTVQDILYGHSHSKRSARCFLFMLEDKTIVSDASTLDEEAGMGTGRLYGICVVHPRLISAVVAGSSSTQTMSSEGNAAVSTVKLQYDYESLVCYAFITRYPMFDFFFQVIFDMITAERLYRMEQIALGTEVANIHDADGSRQGSTVLGLSSYQYLPSKLLTEILDRLTKVHPPRYNESIVFNGIPSMASIVAFRHKPPENGALEHMIASSAWALPTLLYWIPVETLVWTIGLVLCEAKVIVVGSEPGMVSCAVLGLLSLIRPLLWLAPLIPMLPVKHIDFVESPVPILAGLIHDSHEASSSKYSATELLKKCNDADNGTVSAVLDLNERELYTSGCNEDILGELLLPGAEALIDRLNECLSVSRVAKFGSHQTAVSPSPSSRLGNGAVTAVPSKSRALYSVTQQQKEESRAAQELVERHILTLIEMGKMVEEKIKRNKAAEIARTLCHPLHETAEYDNLKRPENSSSPNDYVIGVAGAEACAADVDAYDESDEESILLTVDGANQGPPVEAANSPQAPVSSSSTTSWVTGLSSFAKTWSSGNNSQGQAVSVISSTQTLNGDIKNVNAEFSDEEEEEETSDKEDLKELGDYYSSFITRKGSKDVDIDSPKPKEALLTGGSDDASAVILGDTDQSPGKTQTPVNRSRSIIPALSSSGSLRSLTQPQPKDILPSTPSRSSSSGASGVGGFFSGLLGGGSSTVGSAVSFDSSNQPVQSNSTLTSERTSRFQIDGVIALSKEPMNCDADSFMRRFIITQMFAEMFGEFDVPDSFDEDAEEDAPTASAAQTPVNESKSLPASPAAPPSPVELSISESSPSDSPDQSQSSKSSPLTSLIGSLASTANLSLNIRPIAKSLSIQTSAGLGLAVDNLGLGGGKKRPHSMRASIASIGPLATSITTSSSNLMAKLGKQRSKSMLSSADVAVLTDPDDNNQIDSLVEEVADVAPTADEPISPTDNGSSDTNQISETNDLLIFA